MSQNLCKWFTKSSSSKSNKKTKAIQPNIPNLAAEISHSSTPLHLPLPFLLSSQIIKLCNSSSDTQTPSTFNISTSKKTIKVFTDGSTINNGKRVEIVSGGVGVYFGKNDARNISKKGNFQKGNRQCMRINRLYSIFTEQVINSEDTMDFVEVKIYSDSEYTIKFSN